MFNSELQAHVKAMFRELKHKSNDIIETSPSCEIALNRIMKSVSSTVSAESEGYIAEMYSALASRIKKEEFFQDPVRLDAFYRLNLREELNNKFHFEIDSLDAYKKGIDFKEADRIYYSVGLGAGTFAVGGILKFALAGAVDIPFIVILAGALAVACIAYFKMVPERNKSGFKRAVEKFLENLENEILDWLVAVEGYLEKQVRTLYSL